MKIGIYTWAGMGNLGDDWLVSIAAELLAEYDHDVYFVIEPRATPTSAMEGCEVLRWPTLRAKRRDKKAFWGQIDDFDILIFAGGGWLAGDQGWREPLNWYLRARKLRTRTLGLCLGLGPFNAWHTEVLGQLTLKKIATEGLFVRSREDIYWAHRLGETNPRLISDLAFAAAPHRGILQADRSTEMKTVVCLPALTERLSGGENPSAVAERFIEALKDAHISLTDCRFLSFQGGEHDDYLFWKSYFPRRLFAENIEDALAIFRSADLVISGRLHSTIAATNAGVQRIISIGYHHKFDLLVDLGLAVTSWKELDLSESHIEPDVAEALARLAKRQINYELRQLWDEHDR